ncbi:ubiquinone biosynthesis monooxygenase Coq6 [Fistulifera solaris]|uniref:Ubiquinone biosynthesis monooxygenase Coq6 n=1 Tax=Fistulifera solaris TaxID=1519565 RepID=A0A1Z5KM55_FISSO|nr:ubiquinone biosynthesis monooxygenase Coq6 [Fistulifera solaris]|eukprot:GAX27111.1 ubiquinone biosynthesis monooxygenase Coq6 [Fistulifera solaris]
MMLSTVLSKRTALRYLSTKAVESVDVLIVGGGVVGLGMAASLQRTLPHLQVRVLEVGQAPSSASKDSLVPHPRSYALSPASLQFLQLTDDDSSQEQPQQQQQQQQQDLGFYQRMQVWEARQPAFLNFGIEDLTSSSSSSSSKSCLGAVVEDSFLIQTLSSRLAPDTIQYEATVIDWQLPSHTSQGLAQVTLNTGTRVQCQLLVAADGANSPLRKRLGIASRVHEYGETALTCTVEIDDDDSSGMQHCAFQRFVGNEGILALLPTRSNRHAIVVWSTRPEQVEHWKKVPLAQLMEYWNQLLQQGPQRLDPLFPRTDIPVLSNIQYGAEKVWEMIQYGSTLASVTHRAAQQSFLLPPLLLQTASPLLSFPLQLRQVARYTAPRVALVGDAAHTVHPMAGQGLNLGLQDLQCLLKHLQKADDAGMDLATFIENGYEQSRQQQVLATVQGIHALHQLFRSQSTILQHLKTFGMNVVQTVPPVRSLLVQAACGGLGR